MYAKTLKIIFIFTCLISGPLAFGLDTLKEEKTCRDIGFTKKNPQFGNCVLELLDRGAAYQASQRANISNQQSYRSSPARGGSNLMWDMKSIANSNTQITYLNRPDTSIYDTIKVEDA